MLTGLSDAQVAQAREQHGSNRLTELAKESFWGKLRNNFGDPMIKILCVALAVNVLLACLGQAEWYETVGIAAAVVLATFVSTWSEYRNENTFQKLQEAAARILCKVYRNGALVEVGIDDLVVGDVGLLQTGDKVPADGVVIEGGLKVDQSVLNGESEEVSKTAAPAGYACPAEVDFADAHRVYRGAVVCSGNAAYRVSGVGDGTTYGQLARELQAAGDRQSPLQVKLASLARQISRFGYLGGAAIALALLFQRVVVHNGWDMVRISAYCANSFALLKDAMQALMLAVVIIVMAVPEGLPLMIAIVSALNMRRMLQANVLVRTITGIETAGSLNLLFTDKTGTLTKGKLEAVVFIDGSGQRYERCAELGNGLADILAASVYGNTSAVVSGGQLIGGNATERAVMAFVGEPPPTPLRVARAIQFSSANKYSAAMVEGRPTLIKGAPERILQRCSCFYDSEGRRQPLRGLDGLNAILDGLAGRAIRLLALATADEAIDGDALPDGNDWTLVGIVGIRDDIRRESADAMLQVQGAGVQVIMITGDRRETAVAIAREVNLLRSDGELVLTSDELAAMSDDDVKGCLRQIRVIARALPSDKSRLVRLAQSLGLVVGMTGDGVNDAPALKRADVGFAMGSGTEVAKEAGDIVILDDNFFSIKEGIWYGRTIFHNVRKFITFQLTINVSAVLISFVAPLLGMDNPLTITQILWVNLVMDTLAAMAFGGEPALAGYMSEQPKRRDEAIITGEMWREILLTGGWTFAASLAFLRCEAIAGQFRAADDGRFLLTGFFTFFVMSAVCNAFNARTRAVNLLSHLTENAGFVEIILLIVAVQVAMVYMGGAVLRCHGLTAHEWLVVLLMAASVIPVDLARKMLSWRKDG